MTVADDIVTKEANMPDTKESRNKALFLKAFDALFNRRDYAEADAGHMQLSPMRLTTMRSLVNLIWKVTRIFGSQFSTSLSGSQMTVPQTLKLAALIYRGDKI